LSEVVPSSIDASNLQPRLSEALSTERVWAENDRAQVERLSAELGNGAHIVEVPSFDQDVYDLAALAQVANFLTNAA
jgi:hypothetical protein